MLLKTVAPRSCACLFLTCLASATPLAAQQIRGTVRSQNGRPIAGARLQRADSSVLATTDSVGVFRATIRAASTASVTATAVGFRPTVVTIPAVGTNAIRELAITLAPLYRLDALAIIANADRPLLNTENATTGGALERKELTSLPTDSRDPMSLLFNVAGITPATGFFGDAPTLSFNAQNSLYTSYLLDGLDNTEGFLGGPRVEFPLAGLARIDALVNSYSTSYGRSPSGVVNQFSRAGSNDRHGELFVYNRPGTRLGIDGDNTVPYGAQAAAVRRRQEGFRRTQAGGALAGALIPNHTFYSLAAEYTDENEDRISSTALASFLGTERRRKGKLFARLDHAWSSSQFSTVRVASSLTNRAGTGSGVVTPEADNITQRYGGLYAITHRSALSGGLASNVLSAQLGTYVWNFPPRSGAVQPQVTIVGPAPAYVTQAVVGSTNFVFDEREVQWQLRDVYEHALGTSHTVRAGADITAAQFKLFAAGTNPLGSYVVVNTGNISAPSGRQVQYSDIPQNAQVLSYTVDARPQRVNLTQAVYGVFAEDVWKLTPSLTTIVGLRWDYDDVTSRGQSTPDLTAFQPRLSFNWYRTSRSVVRGGVGVFAGKFPYATLSDAQQLGIDGNATVTFAGQSAPAFGRGPALAGLASATGQLPAREVFTDFSRGLKIPRSYQATLGYQRQLGEYASVSVDAVYSRTTHLPRLLDLNPISRALTAADTANLVCSSATSCPGDRFRTTAPVNSGYRRLSTAETGGRSEYAGLYFSARRQLANGLTIDANYVLSHAMSDAEDINFSATQANCFGKNKRDAVTGAACASTEWGVANNDRTHRATVRTVWTPNRAVRFSAVTDVQSGQPFNRVAGVTVGGGQSRYDLLGSGAIRGNSFIGNNDRYAGVPRNGERLPGYSTTNLSAAITVPVRTQSIEIRADLFNTFNATSWAGFATGTGGNGNIVQTGRPGDPIYNFTPGPPRQLQLSAGWVF